MEWILSWYIVTNRSNTCYAEPVPSRNSCVRRKLKGIGFRLTNLPLYSLSVYIRLILIFERKMIVEMQHFRVYMCHYARQIGKPFFTNSYLSSFLAKFSLHFFANLDNCIWLWRLTRLFEKQRSRATWKPLFYSAISVKKCVQYQK